jgi:hypothetical protein
MAQFRLRTIAVVVLVAGVGLTLVHILRRGNDDSADGQSNASATFEGDSDELGQTVVVPTLDTPIPHGQSAVWCASFQLAWDKLKSDVVKGPVAITNAKVVCDRLNRTDAVAADLPHTGYFAAAGSVGDGIVNTVRKGMAEKFPNVSLSDLTDEPDGVLAFAYLEAKVDYQHPYRVNQKQLRFPSSGGDSRLVNSFGIPLEGELDLPEGTRDQAGVLFAETDGHHFDVADFAIDLDRNSRPNQVVVARLIRKDSLAETLTELEERIRTYSRQELGTRESMLGINDTLLVPNMHWKVRHQFRELLGSDKLFEYNGQKLPMIKAEQTVAFRLDARGADVASKAEVRAKSGPRHFEFDRPFLLYLKKRDAERPFFVMWVENAELLSGSGS